MPLMRRSAISAICLLLAVAPTACQRSRTASTETTDQVRQVEVSRIDLGRSVGTDKRVTDQTESFAPKDAIYASVITSGSAPSTEVKARWTYQDGQVVEETSQTISPSGDAATEFHIVKPDGWPAGKYRLEVFLNGTSAGTKEFEVRS